MHLSEAIKIIDAGQPVTLEVLTKDGSIMKMEQVVRLSRHVRGGTHRMKFIQSGQIREIRDCLIISLNNEETYI